MPALPSSLSAIASLLRPAFTAPTFQIFEALLAGFVGRVGEHTVTGMWQAARLAGRLHHSRAHDFFARASWSCDRLGLLLLDFLIERFVDADAPISLAVDGSVFARSGRKVHGAVWHHDSSAAPGGGFRFGNCFVVIGLVVRIAALGARAWCLPVLFRLWLPTPKPTTAAPDPERRPSQQDLAALLVAKVAERYPTRRIDVVGDSAFGCKAMAALPERATLTSRLRANAVIHAPAPARSPAAGEAAKEQKPSSPCAATSKPRANKARTSSPSSKPQPKASPGYPPPAKPDPVQPPPHSAPPTASPHPTDRRPDQLPLSLDPPFRAGRVSRSGRQAAARTGSGPTACGGGPAPGPSAS